MKLPGWMSQRTPGETWSLEAFGSITSPCHGFLPQLPCKPRRCVILKLAFFVFENHDFPVSTHILTIFPWKTYVSDGFSGFGLQDSIRSIFFD